MVIVTVENFQNQVPETLEAVTEEEHLKQVELCWESCIAGFVGVTCYDLH